MVGTEVGTPLVGASVLGVRVVIIVGACVVVGSTNVITGDVTEWVVS